MPFVIVVVLVIMAIGAIYSMIQSRKRREGLFELAQRLGLNFSAAEDYGLADQLWLSQATGTGRKPLRQQHAFGKLSAK